MKKPIQKSRQTKPIVGTIPNAFKCAKTLVQTLSIETFFILSWQKQDNLTCVSSTREIMRSMNKWEMEKEKEKKYLQFPLRLQNGLSDEASSNPAMISCLPTSLSPTKSTFNK